MEATAQIGRNAPCPCNSGKKYKKCCLALHEAQHREALAAAARLCAPVAEHQPWAAAPPAPTPRELSPDDQRWKEFWDRFRAAPLAGRLEMAQEIIETEPEFDGALAFELVEGIVELTKRAGLFAEAEALMDLIAARRPAAFATEAGWFHLWRTEAALLRGDADVLTPLLAFAERPGAAVDFFSPLLDRLRFHGKVDEAIVAALKAWSALREDGDIVAPQDWLAEPAARMIIDRWLQANPEPQPQDDSLWEALAPLHDTLARDPVEEDVELHARRPQRIWRANDFQESSEHDLYLLSLDFRDALHRRFGWHLARAELARAELDRLLSKTSSEGLKGKRPKAKRLMFLSDAASIDKHITKMVGFMGLRAHRAAALALALPRWLSFLTELGLVERQEAARIASDVRQRLEALPHVIDEIVYDPVLQDELGTLGAALAQV